MNEQIACDFKGEIVVPAGFQFNGGNAGIKKTGKKDFGVAIADEPCAASAVFTKNKFCGECIPIGKKAVKNGVLQAIVVTSGIANVATGKQGTENETSIIDKLSKRRNISGDDVLPSSTGIIGVQLPIESVLESMDEIIENVSPDAFMDFAESIITTDSKIKIENKKIGEAAILATAKGAGMIEPNMATMLSYIFTDAKVSQPELDLLLKKSVEHSFNSMSVDTDTSTSDTVVIMSSGKYEVDAEEFGKVLDEVCISLCRQIVDGAEGSKHRIEVTVADCADERAAKLIGKSVVNSPLVKTAVYGCDPNWGRIVMAVGKTEGADFDKNNIAISIGNYCIFKDGSEVSESLPMIKKYLDSEHDIRIKISVGTGDCEHTVYGCDLTEEYVRINSYYST